MQFLRHYWSVLFQSFWVADSTLNEAAERKTKGQSGTPKVDGGEPAKRKASSSATQKHPKKIKTSKKGGLAKPRAASSASGKSSLMAVESDSDDIMLSPSYRLALPAYRSTISIGSSEKLYS
ncbi:hypothetical protein B0H14DRAFT_2608062 [Mycena olivaceomarginata]|nr:hypothetical protein B0H14DRAFT_2608062 [Mycena olivaceomarginata]